MNCQELIDFLIDYRAGDLPPKQREAFEQHLAKCPPCKHYLDTYCKTIDLAKRCCCCPEAPKVPQVPDELVKAILDARKKS